MRIRRRIKIKAIKGRSKRHSTFTKRRNGLFKETNKLCKMADAKAGVFVFSEDGNAFGFSHPDVEEVIDRYDLASTSGANQIEASGAVKAADPPLTEVERRLMEALESDEPAWDVVVKDLGVKELDELQEAMTKIQSRLKAARR